MSIKDTVKNMIGMKFGNYNDCKNSKNYVEVKEKFTPFVMSSMFGNIKSYTDGHCYNNGKHVATVSHSEYNGEFNYSVYDVQKQRTYSSGWNSTGDTKLNYITFNNYAIEDANKNGEIDEADLIYVNDGQGNKQTIKEFLG